MLLLENELGEQESKILGVWCLGSEELDKELKYWAGSGLGRGNCVCKCSVVREIAAVSSPDRAIQALECRQCKGGQRCAHSPGPCIPLSLLAKYGT